MLSTSLVLAGISLVVFESLFAEIGTGVTFDPLIVLSAAGFVRENHPIHLLLLVI